MALPTSGLITLNAVHIEKDGFGASGQPVTLNDADLRQMNAGPGRTIPTGSGTAIELADFYGATDTHQITVTNGITGVYIGGASSWRINGFMTTGSFGTGNGGYPSTGSINSNSRSGYYNGSTVRAVFSRYHTNAKYTDLVFVLDGQVQNGSGGSSTYGAGAAGWEHVKVYHAGVGFGGSSSTIMSRYYANYGYDANRNVTRWSYQIGYSYVGGQDVPPWNASTNATTYVEVY